MVILISCQQEIEEELPVEEVVVSEEITFGIRDKNANRIFEVNEELSFELGYTASLGEKFIWEFGTGDTSHVRNPMYTFPKEGKYLVTLVVDGSLESQKKIEILDLIQPVFFDSVFTIQATEEAFVGEEIVFKARGTGVDKWYWEFGDEDYEYEETNPQIMHIYKKPGKYTVKATTNVSGDFPTYHNILIHPKFEAVQEEEPVDTLKLIGEDLKIRFQKIADTGVRDDVNFKKLIKEIEKLYFCDTEKRVGVRVNGKDKIDINTFYDRIHHFDSAEDESVQIMDVIVEEKECLKIINVVQE